MVFANYDHAGVGAAVNGDTVYVAVLFSTDLGLKRLGAENGTGASTITSLENPAAASQAKPETSQPVAPQPAYSPPQLRGGQGLH
jgi:hypothetical protein